MKRLQDNEFFVLSDIILSAKTYGDTCFMDAELYSSEVKKTYDEALREFDKLVIPEDAILRAAGECGIEMNRNIVEVDRSELSKKLREVQLSPWCKQIDMAYRKAHDESSVNTLFRASYIKYSKESDDLFVSAFWSIQLMKVTYRRRLIKLWRQLLCRLWLSIS